MTSSQPSAGTTSLEDALRSALAEVAELRAEAERRCPSGEVAEAARLTEVLERLHDGVVTVDRRLRVQYANAAARRILAPGRVRRAALLPDPWPTFSLRGFAARLFEPGATPVDRRVRTEEDRAIVVHGVPLGDTDVAALIVADVSEQERRDRAERDFIENAAHELRTPVASIAAAVEVLQSGAKESPDDRDRFLGHIERAVQRLSRLSRALLVLARAQTSVEAPRTELIELGPLLEAAAASGVPTDVEIRVSCPREIVVVSNRDLLEQVLANLVGNAVKYTQRGRISINALVTREETVHVEVSDTGPGIDEAIRDRIFERFYRGGPTGDGFGLGLSIALEAARAAGAGLVLESAPGAGTTARLTLPSGRIVA